MKPQAVEFPGQSAPPPTPPVPAATQPPPQNASRNVSIILTYVLVVVISVLILVGFIIQLGGVGDLHKKCDDSVIPASRCRDLHRFDWWATFSQLIIVVLIALVVALGMLNELRSVALFFLGIATFQMIFSTDYYLDRDDESGARAAAAGYIFSIMGNFLLSIAVGCTGMPTPRYPFNRARPAEGATPQVPVA